MAKSTNNRPFPTDKQRVLEAIGTALLRKSRFYPKRKHREYQPVEADAVSNSSRLRATWQGRP